MHRDSSRQYPPPSSDEQCSQQYPASAQSASQPSGPYHQPHGSHRVRPQVSSSNPGYPTQPPPRPHGNYPQGPHVPTSGGYPNTPFYPPQNVQSILPGGNPAGTGYPPSAELTSSSSSYRAHPQQPSSHVIHGPSSGFMPTHSQRPQPHPQMHQPRHSYESGRSENLTAGYHPAAPVHPNPNMSNQTNEPATSSTGRSSTMSHNQPATTASHGERFECDSCTKTFSRSHDRKRHKETHHAPTPVVHKCSHCDKGFSRGDSLKRHTDNGCGDSESCG